MAPAQEWNAASYEKSYGYVWQAASDLVDVLAPQPGERVLDLGCGTGHLTAKIAERGATVVGLDADTAMIEEARRRFPGARFEQGDALAWRTPQSFDAIFSNAALHWMPDADAVAETMTQALKPGGRLVAEFGGRGNIQHVACAITDALKKHGLPADLPWYFPGIAEYGAVLERHGLELVSAALFDRPTPLQDGLSDWLRMFGASVVRRLPESERGAFLEEVEKAARPALFRNGRWIADYRRLRVVARRTAGRS